MICNNEDINFSTTLQEYENSMPKKIKKKKKKKEQVPEKGVLTLFNKDEVSTTISFQSDLIP